MKRTLAVMLAAITAAVLAGPGAANAGGPVRENFVAVADRGATFTGWFWIDEMNGIIGCPQCIWLIDLSKSEQLTEVDERVFTENLMAGLARLGDAGIAGDPRTADALRRQALDRFTVAARALGTASVRVGVVGVYDTAKRAKVAYHRDWLTAADQDLADGLTLLQRSFTDPSPQPYLTAAVAQFDEAFAEISQKRAIGS